MEILPWVAGYLFIGWLAVIVACKLDRDFAEKDAGIARGMIWLWWPLAVVLGLPALVFKMADAVTVAVVEFDIQEYRGTRKRKHKSELPIPHEPQKWGQG